MSSLDVLVMPSFTEGTPMTMLEAMAANIPVIASNVGDIPEIIETNKNGILTIPGQASEIEIAIEKILNSEIFKRKIELNAELTIKENFNIKNWIKVIENLYEKIVRNNKMD
jgi:glycosyltransferase involved in cell wall biosynthesis